MQATTRRGFLLAVAGAGALIAVPWAWRRGGNGRADGNAGLPGGLRSFSQEGFALGAAVSLQVLHHDEATARTALRAAFEELRTVESVMSIYRPDSQLSQLNREGALDRPHPYLVDILQTSQELSKESAGAFDVTVQPLWNLYAAAQRAGGSPEEDQVRTAVGHVGYRRLHVTPERIELQSPGMGVTLNGIAQGYATDRVMGVLREHGITQALVNAGEVGPLGRTAQGRPWRVGIQHPRRPEAYIALADLDGRSLATSGDYATTFTADRREHHIFNPATGHSPTEVASVSVVAPTTTLADGLTKPLLIGGPEKGRRLLAAHPRTDALFVLKDGTVIATAGFPRAQA